MPTYAACLIDVFDTVLSVDRRRHVAGIAELVGVPVADFTAAAQAWGPAIGDGRASLAEVIRAVLRDGGRDPSDTEVADLVVADLRLQQELVVLYDDVVPFLQSLRAAGVRTAFVSNCAENTRPLLDGLGLSGLVDHLVLSCEVGEVKPEAAIYRRALDRVGAEPGQALFVDDQRSYCAGAADLGIEAVRIDRFGGSGEVSTLADLVSESWISLP